MTDPGRHLYVHVPFCSGKCVYCAFYSEKHTPGRSDLYLDALARELDRHLEAYGRPVPETIYFGGGTPSILPARPFERLLEIVRSRTDLTRLREWTVEGNPGTFTPDKIAALRANGVNRVSLGVQSLDNAVLRRIGRRHSASDVARAVALLRDGGIANLGLDLIASLPGVSDAQWIGTLTRTLALRPRHVSVYALTAEEGSRLHTLAKAGRLRMADAAAELRSLEIAERQLNAAGYTRYEFSNYALPGFECLHNLSCWQGGDYLGVGPAAASRSGRARWTNRPDLSAYSTALLAGSPPPREEETLTKQTDVTERLVFGFRLRDGIDLAQFCRRFAVRDTLRQQWERTLDRLSLTGLAKQDGTRWTLTRRGRNLADTVAAELME